MNDVASSVIGGVGFGLILAMVISLLVFAIAWAVKRVGL